MFGFNFSGANSNLAQQDIIIDGSEQPLRLNNEDLGLAEIAAIVFALRSHSDWEQHFHVATMNTPDRVQTLREGHRIVPIFRDLNSRFWAIQYVPDNEEFVYYNLSDNHHDALQSYFDTEMKKKPGESKSLFTIFDGSEDCYGRYLFQAGTPYKVDRGLVDAIDRVWNGRGPSPFATRGTMRNTGFPI